ncbi:MAG: porin, partial [Armatimonadetes bacterium]|nr:porin [Armatimonadota bacterium]
MVPASRRWLGVVLVTALAMLLGTSAVWSDTGSIGSDDWQYRELDALAQAGLLNGHPAGPLSDWADRLTRYEGASLTLRAVEGLANAYQEQGDALYRVARAEMTDEVSAVSAVKVEDVARVEKLIEEFRSELVTMGARVDDLETALGDVQARLGKVEAEQKKHKIDGYAQFRYENDDGSDENQFLMRRARVNVRGPASERVSYRIEFQLDAKVSGSAAGSKVQLRTAYADYALNTGTLRIGQAKIPWGYELLESVPVLWTAERSLFMDRLFPNQRDIGVQWSYRSSPSAPQFDVGIFNGTGINASDNNDRKNVMARVDFPVQHGTVALSTYVGEDG